MTPTFEPPSWPSASRPPTLERNSEVHATTINSPRSVTYPATSSLAINAYSNIRFRYAPYGPVHISGASPTEIEQRVLVRTVPPKFQSSADSQRVTITGSGLRGGVRVYLQGPRCTAWPPTLCGVDFVECRDVQVAVDGNSLRAEVPVSLLGNWRLVVEDPGWVAVGGAQWHSGPMLNFTPPSWPRLHGFDFWNEDDHPSLEEFEACYGDSIFFQPPFPVPVRNPHYAFWAIIYGA